MVTVIAAALFSLLVLIGPWLIPVPTQAQDAPVFIVGQRYLFAWDCWPEWAPHLVSQMAAGGQPLDPCYAEPAEVRTVWRNGWLTVRYPSGQMWNINPSRAIGYQPLPQGEQRVGR